MMGFKQGECPAYAGRLSAARELIEKAVMSTEEMKFPQRELIWLELTGCSGNIISLLDGADPDFGYMLHKMVRLTYSNSLMSAEGEAAMDALFSEGKRDYILAVEGAVSTKEDGMSNIIGRWRGEPITALKALKILGDKASHIIAVGACATHGGVSAARPNPMDCVGVQSILQRKVIKLPGCPCHPDWFMGTLAHILLYGEPALDSSDRPLMFYSMLIHDRCPRRYYFDKGIFADKLGEKTCMFKLGCRGPVTRIDCPVRQWNEYVNWPIKDDTPCIGCAQFGFPDAMAPFVTYDTTRRGK